ncbi:MAG: hypothetical protein M1814_000116 [Vezdaea aestivalis]|nr:MAG: hypothetical protein M1814_000116 [Vezdaea aestivalis]
MQAFDGYAPQSKVRASKNADEKKLKFELQMRVHDLNNIPLVSGNSYVKWQLSSAASAEHNGRTPKSPIKDHKVVWDYQKTLTVRLTTDKGNMLEKTEINFEVIQEYNYGVSRNERIELGKLSLNLAEYVDQEPARALNNAGSKGGDVTEELGVTRRYLMQNSKINSTLKISIIMTQTEGDHSFIAPPLRTAPVFSGIAGVLTHETHDNSSDEANSTVPPLAHHTIKPTEICEAQDMYRRTLTASWAAQFGELPADECIESIFSGGTGWREGHSSSRGSVHERGHDGFLINASKVWAGSGLGIGGVGIDAKDHRKGSSSGGSGAFGFKRSGGSGGKSRVASTGKIELTSSSGEGGDSVTRGRAGLGEHTIAEMDAREDMRSWVLPDSISLSRSANR